LHSSLSGNYILRAPKGQKIAAVRAGKNALPRRANENGSVTVQLDRGETVKVEFA
jgi:hypothetical protein